MNPFRPQAYQLHRELHCLTYLLCVFCEVMCSCVVRYELMEWNVVGFCKHKILKGKHWRLYGETTTFLNRFCMKIGVKLILAQRDVVVM